MKPIILIGFMASGKSTLGPMLAQQLERKFIDLDDAITAKVGPIHEYFQIHGEASFRHIETEVLQEALSTSSIVIAAGGGIVESSINRKILYQEFQVIYLQATFDTLWHRIQQDNQNVRPVAQAPKTTVYQRFNQREALYEEVAHLTVSVEDTCPKAIIKQIIKKLVN